MLNPEIKRLACQLQNAAYLNGQVDTNPNSSERRCAEACDRSDKALAALLEALGL